MAAKAVILHAALFAAAFVAAPAFAQTNDPNLNQTQVDCLNRTTAAGAGCDKDGGAKSGGGARGAGTAVDGAVSLPALIVALSPTPPAGAAPQTSSPSNGTSSSNGAASAPTPPPSGPVTVPQGLNLAEPPRAIS